MHEVGNGRSGCNRLPRARPSFFAVDRSLGVHHQTVQRCIERAVALWSIDARRAAATGYEFTAEAESWLVSPAARRRSWAIRTSCGRRGSWYAMPASMNRRQGMSVLPIWPKASCARFLLATR
jgi:hypothetical protein